MVRLEHLGLLLVQRVGIATVAHERRTVPGRDVLLVEAFDAPAQASGRWHFFSALTALDLHEMEALYASYPDLADYLRRFAPDAAAQCRELYRRMLFNILIGNTDDHARNHAVFWDGHDVTLTPAYDICPLPRTGFEASQAMAVGEQGNYASLANALSSCGRFGLAAETARAMAEDMMARVSAQWADACEMAGLPGSWRASSGSGRWSRSRVRVSTWRVPMKRR